MVAVCLALMRVAFEFRHERATPWRVLILGGGPLASRIAQEIESSGRLQGEPAGMVDDRPPQGPWPWLGRLDRLKDIVEKVHPNHIVVALEDRRGHLPLAQLLESRARGVIVEEALAVYERLTGKVAIEALTPGALIMTKGFRNDPTSEKAARLVSVTAAIVGLIVLAPFLALIALAIKMDSRGPILFFQDRAGKNGQAFSLWKFRTMRPAEFHRSEWVQDNFHRITPLGRLLRRFRIDELPQLVNILRGEMNLVGPRPHPMSNQEVFMDRIAYYGLRSTVQARGHRVGADSVRLREQHRPGNGKDAVRPLLHQESVALARCHDHRSHVRDHAARIRVEQGAQPRPAASGRHGVD